jgi:uncharacterized protein YjbI with pentapeptide repeats
MSPDEIKKVLNNHAKWLANDGGSRANLSHADLSHANLSRANLSGANLSRANLYGANLSRADLSRADLSHADLSRADLSRADLSRANLYGKPVESWSMVQFSGHGECGRTLTGIKTSSDIYFFCGCFSGTKAELVKYIKDGCKTYAKTRTLAMKTVLMLLKAKNPGVNP